MKPFILFLILGQGYDTATSLKAFSIGMREQNPFIISTQPAPFITQVSLVTVGEVLIAKKLEKNHPKLAKVLASIQIGGSGFFATRNIVRIRRHQERLRAEHP